MNYMLTALLVLGTIALVSAFVLYYCSKHFAVKEDERIGKVASLLPQANCGGCGFAGCSGMAAAIVKAADGGSIEGFNCPVGGGEVMGKIAEVLGVTVADAEPRVAVLRCGGSCTARQRVVEYDGLRTCAAMNVSGMGETACAYGCLGCGDCVSACSFGGIKLNETTGLPEIDETVCTGCGSCAKTCPRGIIELRPRGLRGRRVFVACRNQDRGALAMKACSASCIGCGKCAKECKFDAITIENNVAYIDPAKCKMCRKCEKACPRKAIKAVNFPAPKQPAQQPASASDDIKQNACTAIASDQVAEPTQEKEEKQ